MISASTRSAPSHPQPLVSIKKINTNQLMIVDENKMFTLISVDKTTKNKTVKLELSGNPFIPREFDAKKHFKCQLIIH
jgi:hypothetical protein